MMILVNLVTSRDYAEFAISDKLCGSGESGNSIEFSESGDLMIL